MRTLRRLVLLCVLVLAGGCALSLDVNLDLEADGSGLLEVLVTADAELQGQAEALGVDPLGRAVERIQASSSDWTAEVVEGDSGARLALISVDIAEAAEVQQRIDELRGALATDEATLLGPLSVTVDDESQTIEVSGEVVALVGPVAAEDAGTTVEDLTAQLRDVVSTSLTINAPGPLLEGGEGARVTSVDPEDPQSPVTLRWEARPGQQAGVAALLEQPVPDLTMILIQAGAGVLAVLAIIGGVLAQRARRR